MKTFLLLITLIIVCASSFFGQAAGPEKPQSKLEQFSARSGGLLEKRFIDIGSINRVKVQTFVLKDLITSTVLTGVRFEYVSVSSYSTDTKTAVLDADEIDGLIKSIGILKANVFNTTPTDYTEVVYSSRGGFSAGAFFSKTKWTTFVKLEKYDSKSAVFMETSDFDGLLSILLEAKEKLK